MNIFFDTEFTGLHKDTTLISMGLESEDNKRFYAEFTDYNKDQVTDWIRRNVIKNLKFPKEVKAGLNLYIRKGDTTYVIGNKTTVKERLIEWLKQFNDVQLVSDVCHFDMVLFIDIFGQAFHIPPQVTPACYDINQDLMQKFSVSGSEAFNMNREEILQHLGGNIDGELQKHNALFDAHIIHLLYDKLHNKKEYLKVKTKSEEV